MVKISHCFSFQYQLSGSTVPMWVVLQSRSTTKWFKSVIKLHDGLRSSFSFWSLHIVQTYYGSTSLTAQPHNIATFRTKNFYEAIIEHYCYVVRLTQPETDYNNPIQSSTQTSSSHIQTHWPNPQANDQNHHKRSFLEQQYPKTTLNTTAESP